jgi:hypothetical protein
MPMDILEYTFTPALADFNSKLAVDLLISDLAFCHPGIIRIISFNQRKGKIKFQIDPDKTSNNQEILHQIDSVVKQTIKSLRLIKKKEPIWNNKSQQKYIGSKKILDQFCKEYIIILDSGQYAMNGLAYNLKHFFQQKFLNIAKSMKAELWHIPSIESTKDLLFRTGYLSSHPQHVTFGYHLPPHYETINKFSQTAAGNDYNKLEALNLLQYTGFILESVVCHNVYRALRGSRISGQKIITAEGNCYRFEGFRFEPLLYQWEFTMREIIFFGNNNYVRSKREQCIQLMQKLVQELDLTSWLEVATDPFFVSTSISKRTFQFLYETKLELQAQLDDIQSIAAASFNLHGTHFTEAMDIRDKQNNLLETACVGFGIERWIAAFIARWSDNIQSWPNDLKYEIL